IVQAASQLIRCNRSSSQLTLWTENEQGKPIRLRPFISEIDEADWVAAEIHRLIQRTHDPVSPKDIAVLVRVMAHATPVEHALMHRRIPYEVVGARPFLEYPEVRELVTYLKLLENPNDLLSLKQIMRLHGIGIELANRVIERCRQLNMNAFDYITYQLPFETAYKSWEIRKLQNLSGAYNRLAGRMSMGLCAAISEFVTFSKVLEGLENQPDEYTEAEVRLEQVAQLAAQYESARKDANLSEFLSFLLEDAEDAEPDRPKVQN